MKLTFATLRKMIKEELSRVLNENIEINPSAQSTWKSYDNALEDMDDLYMWLNEIGDAFKDYKRYGDKLESDGIEELLANNNIQLPITDLEIAVKLYQMAKAAL